MAKLKYRVRVLLGDQELVLLVPAAPETTVGELQTEVLARARRQGIIGSACAFSVDGALLDELDSVEDVLEVEQPIDARLSPLRECSWSAADLAALAREGFSPALRHTIVDIHASLAAFRRSPDGSRLLPSRVTPARAGGPRRGACSGGRRRERRWGAGRRGLCRGAGSGSGGRRRERRRGIRLAGGGAARRGPHRPQDSHLVAPRSSLVLWIRQRVRRD